MGCAKDEINVPIALSAFRDKKYGLWGFLHAFYTLGFAQPSHKFTKHQSVVSRAFAAGGNS